MAAGIVMTYLPLLYTSKRKEFFVSEERV